MLNHTLVQPKPGLGRIVSYDPRDARFLMAPITPSPQVRKMFWDIPGIMNQGNTFECTAYSAEYLLTCGPVMNTMYKTPHELYVENQQNDEWAATPHQGSSVRAAMKVLQSVGYIESYVWAFDIKTAVNWLLSKGPVVFGTDWYDQMERPNTRTGFISARGRNVGGHAYCIRGCDSDLLCPDGSKGAVRILNSWGPTWGQNGMAWMSYKDADKLIKANGECATPVEIVKLNQLVVNQPVVNQTNDTLKK